MEDQGKRIVLFVVIAAAIFIGWQMLFPPPKSTPKKPPTVSEQQASQSPTWTNGSGSGSAVTPGSGSGSADPAVTAGSGSGSGTAVTPTPVMTPSPAELVAPEQTLDLSSARMQVTLSNLGATIKRIHRGDDPMKGGAMNDDLFASQIPGVGLAASTFLNSTYPLGPRAAWTGEKLSEAKARYTYRADGLTVVKEFELLPDDWMVKVTIDTTVAQAATQQLVLSMFSMAPDVKGQTKWAKKPHGHCNVGGSVSYKGAKNVARAPYTRSGQVRYFGAANPYFMFALSPRPSTGETLECNMYSLSDVNDGVQVDMVYPVSRIGAGETVRKELFGYFGPKYLDRLEHADAVAGYPTGLRDSVSFGWFGVIAKPLLWLLRKIYNLVHNWGIAIILLTLLVKLATLYWTTKSMRSMKAMAALKPEMDALQKKYGDDRQKQQQAQMELFKRHGVNPLAGCLPMLLQMPIWMGLYRMLRNAGELHQAVFIPGWLDDLTLRDPFFILPVALMGLMFYQSRIQPATGDSAQQKMIQYGMPLMFGVMGLWFPSGLTVYITTNTVLGIAHSLYMKHTGPAPKVAKVVEVKAAESIAAIKAKAAGNDGGAGDDGGDDDGGDDDGDDDDADGGTKSGGEKSARPVGNDRRSKRRGKRR